MAWKISKAKRQALVKLQLRDKKGRWIEMGGGVKWYSSRLKKQVSGTVVGTKGENALVRLDKQEGQDRSPLVSVAARNITVIDEKASLAPTTMGTPTDKTSEFEGAIPVANESNGAPKSNGYVKPSDSPEDYQVTETADGRAYIGRNDGAELYFPARSLEVGDVLMAPEGGDETKPFSIGKGWAKKGVESVNTKGPKTGTVVRIEGDRYAVVQLPDGFTVPDKKHEGEQTDLVTVGLSNSVIKLTDGMQSALGEHINATFDGNADEQEVDDSEEENSDHVGREVPEEEVAAEERDPADVDLTDITDGEEEEKAAPITEKAREIDIPQADNSGSDDQTLNENGLTDDEQKLVKAYDRMAQRAYDQGNVENGATYEANANRLRKLGEDRRAGAKADHENTDDTPQKDPQEAERQQKAAEPTPEPESAPEAAPEAQEETPAPNLEEPNAPEAAEESYNDNGFTEAEQAKLDELSKLIGEAARAASRGEKTDPQAYLDMMDERDKLMELGSSRATPAAEEEPVFEGTEPSASGLYTRGFQWLSPAVLNSLPDETTLYAPAKAGSGFTQRSNILDTAKKENGKWYVPDGLKNGERTWAEVQDLKSLKNMNVRSTPRVNEGAFEDFDGNLNGLNTGDRIKLSDGQTGVFAPRKNGAAAFFGDKTGKHHSILLKNPVFKVAKYNSKADDRFLNGYDITKDKNLGKVKKNDFEDDYVVQSTSDDLIAALPVGSSIATVDPERSDAGFEIVKVAPNVWAHPKRYEPTGWTILSDSDMIEYDVAQGIKLPGNPKLEPLSQRELDSIEISRKHHEEDQARYREGLQERAQAATEDQKARESDSAQVDEEPVEKSDAEKQYDALQDEVRAVRYPGEDENGESIEGDLNDPHIKASEDADDNARDSVNSGQVKENTPEWFDIWNSTYHSSLDNQKTEAEQQKLQAEQDAETARLEEEDRAAAEASPEESPEAVPESSPISDEQYAEAERNQERDQAARDAEEFVPGKGMPTLFKQSVRGNARTALEDADESARESEYDQGYRMVDGKIEVHNFDRADSSLEDNLGRWYDLQQSFPTKEFPNRGGYTGGYTKAKVNSVVNGLEKLREAIRAAKADRDSLTETIPIGGKGQSAEHESQMGGLAEGDKIAFTDGEGQSRTYQKNSQGLFDEVNENNEVIDTDLPATDLAWQHRMDSPEVQEPVTSEESVAPETQDLDAIAQHLNENAVLGNDDERRAAGLYLGGARYNDALRSGNVPEMLQEQIDTLAGFIDKQPEFGQETKLYRGGQPLGDVENRIGEVITEPAFMSTSLKRSEAEIFAGSGPVMEITARPQDKALSINAAYMTDQSDIPEEYRQPVDVTAREAEMLLKPSTSFEITGVRDENGRKVVEARIVDSPESSPVESQEAAPELDENGLTPEEARQLEIAREEDYLGGIADKDPESRPYYQKPIDDLLEKGRKRLAGEDVDTPEEAPEDGSYTAESGHTVYTESAPGRVPDLKATAQAVKESGVESVHVPISDAPKKDYTPEELENSFDRREKTGLTDSVFDALPKEFKRFKDQDAPADPINLPEDEEDATEAPESGDRFANLQPTAEEQSQLDEFDKAMDDAVAADDVEAYDKASDAKYDLMEAIAKRDAEEPASESEETEQETTEEPSTETTEDSESESTEESEDTVHPLDALGIKRRTPEAVAGESYAPTQQQQDVIDAVLGGLDTKVQAMAGTGKTSTLVALSRRIAEQGGQAVYIAFNKTVQEEAVRRMEGLPVEPKTGHAVAHTWAQKNMPHLTIRLGGNDPARVTATYANGKPKAYAKKRAWTSARAVGDALGIEAGAVKEEGSGIPKSKSNIVLAVKKTVEKFALSDSDTIQTSHVPEVFEIAESDLPKIVDFANEYWEDLKREDGNFRVTHDVYRKFWALSKPDLTDGTGGTKKGANILYIDEAQDTPPVLAKVVADQKMQKVIVGDANQAIYAFAENIDYLSEADGDIELPLNKSWRFGPEVADAGNRFLQMLGSENRVVGGGGPSKVTYDMEDADAVLVRTNAGMIQAILEETKRDRRVTAPAGTRSNLESLVESVESLKEGYEPEHPHDDLIGYKNWDQVKAAWKSGDRNLNMIVKLFDVVDNYSLSRLKPEQIEEEVARKMADAKKAIDHLVIDVPGFNTVKMVQRDGRTYLEPVDENPYPVDEKGKQKAWGWKEKQYAVSNFSAKLGETRKPWLKDNNLDFGPQQMEYRKKGGLEDVGWTYERGEYFTEDEEAIKRFATYGGQFDVTISTAHKSKGLEWDRVRIGWDFIGPREDPKTGAMIWPEDDEYKLGYVALTRAAKEIDPGSLEYVFQYTQPNGGDPKAGKGNVTVPEDTTPEPEQVADEPPVDVTPDTEKEADDALVFADPEFTPVPETREAPETTPEPEAEEAPEEVAPEVVPDEAPVYDDLTGLTAEEEAYKDSLIEQAKLMSRAKRWSDHQRLVKEYNAMFDKGRERLKLQKQQTKAEEVAPEPVETPEPEAPTPAPEAPTAPEFNEDGLTPEEAARVANLEKWINDVYKGYGQGNVKKMENELDDLYKRGEKRQNGEPDAEAPIDTTPEFETPVPVSLNPEVEPEAPSPVDGVPVVKPMKKSVPTGRRRGQSTVPDADGGEIKVGDTIKHKKFGDVVVTGVLPGAGRVTFISPKTGKESSVKGDAVSLSKETPPAVAEAAGTRLTGTPGDRVMDPITGKKAFIGADGTMIVTGERVRDIKTGQIGIVQTVYTGADKKASVPVLFPGEKEPRRVRGTQLSHADSGGSEASETEPIIPEAPEPAPEAPKDPEPAPEAPEAPEPEVAPTPVVDEKTERRRAAIGNAPEGAEVRSKDGGEVYTKITSDVWENTDASDSMTDDEVLEKILNGEGDGKGYIIRTPSPAPVPEPEPEPEPEVIPEPDTSLSGQELADTITYESTLHMTDGDLADMMARYADDAIVFDKIMEVMDERDANVFLPVDTSKSGATLDDQPALFDMTVPDPTAKTERKLTPAQRASEEYQNYVMSQYNKALEELNGVLLNDAGKAYARGAGGSDLEINLFSGSAAIARKYASEELLQWWMENGRETLASFRYRMYGWEQDRKAAQTVRSLGYERGQIARDRSNI